MTLKFVIRNLQKRPFLNIIKVAGLSLALSSILLIVLFLKHELSFDSFHKNSDNIYRLTTTSESFFSGKHFARMPNPSYVPQMAEFFPEMESFVRLAPMRGGAIKYEEYNYSFKQAFECDSTFFKVFNADLVLGDPESVFTAPGAMVISESFANKVFGNNNPIGEILTLPAGQFYGEDTDYIVNGIMKDFPKKSHFHPDIITTPLDESVYRSWAWTYLLLFDKSDPGKITDGYKKFYAAHIEVEPAEINTEAHLQKISDIHLHSRKTREIEPNSNILVIYSFSIAALLLLCIALINYANLNIGMAGYSERYFFVGKVYGASGRMYLKHFLTECFIIATASLLIGGLMASLVIIYIHKQINLDLITGNWSFIILVSLLISLLSIIAGMLPLIRQLAIRIKSSLDIQHSGVSKKAQISKALIVLQYTISIALIASVIVIHRQTTYALNSSLGKESENLICFEDIHSNVQQKFAEFKEELLKYNSVETVSAMFEPPGGEANDMFRFTMEGFVPDETIPTDDLIGIFPCDFSFASIFDLKFLGGTNFTEKHEDNEGSGEYIINESAMRRLNYNKPDDILGKEFGLVFGNGDIVIPEGKIIGVVEDFHLSSLKRKIDPLVLFKRKNLWLINFVVLFKPGLETTGLSDLEKVWDEIFPEYPMQFEYISSMYRNVYSTELLQSKLLSIFTFIALFICSMGLLGLSLLTTQRRIKEIGIRRVNGAGTDEIMTMLNWDFIKWVLLAFVLAIPFAYFAMTRWLESFAYKTSMSWWIFVLAGLAAVLIALLTVSIQSWRASRSNPIEALRYE